MRPLLASLPLALAVAVLPRAGTAARFETALDAVRAEDIAADVRFLADPLLRGRPTPSRELAVAARFLRARLEAVGFEPGANGSWFHAFTPPVEAPAGPTPLNVCALWPGSDPVLAREWIVISAHYDHLGVRGGAIHPGADDNASGTAGLLALAAALAERGPLPRSVLLLFTAGEERGLWGSEAWADHPPMPPGTRPVCAVNVDMIGRNGPHELWATPSRTHPGYNGLTRLAERLGPREGFLSLRNADRYWLRSDHISFAHGLRIPVLFLFAGEHADYHRPSDTPDKVDCDKVRRVTRLLLRILEELQDPELAL